MPTNPHRPGAEGGGGWPMHATAQPWHAEGRPLTTGVLRRLRIPCDLARSKPNAAEQNTEGGYALQLRTKIWATQGDP